MQVLAARQLAEAAKKQQAEKEAKAKTEAEEEVAKRKEEEAALLYGRSEFSESKYFLRKMPVLAIIVPSSRRLGPNWSNVDLFCCDCGPRPLTARPDVALCCLMQSWKRLFLNEHSCCGIYW